MLPHPVLDPEQRLMAARQRTLTRLLPGIAHDLRGPLNALGLSVELLKGSATQEGEKHQARRQRYVEVLENELGRLQRGFDRLFAQLLSSPSDEAGELDLVALVREVVELASPQAKKEKIELIAELPEAEILIRGRRAHLQQAVLSTVVYALDLLAAGPGEGRLTLRLESGAERVRLTVGAAAPRLSLPPTAPEDRQEPDPDLEVVAFVIEAHGGTLNLVTEPDRGIEVYLELPAPGTDDH